MCHATINVTAEQHHTWQELGAFLTKRIHDGQTGKVSTKSVNEILEEELARDDQPTDRKAASRFVNKRLRGVSLGLQ